jgi:hypothetical protein
MSHGDSMHDDSGSNHRCRVVGPVAWATRVAGVTLWFLVHGCDMVSGGAVELSWKLRPASSSLEDKFVECNSAKPLTGEVSHIVLHWVVNGTERATAWPCDFNHGVTGFDLAEGTAQLWVTPACVSGDAAPDTYIAPAMVERRVLRGETVSLGAVELVVAVSECRDPGGPELQPGRRPCICCGGDNPCTPPPR